MSSSVATPGAPNAAGFALKEDAVPAFVARRRTAREAEGDDGIYIHRPNLGLEAESEEHDEIPAAIDGGDKANYILTEEGGKQQRRLPLITQIGTVVSHEKTRSASCPGRARMTSARTNGGQSENKEAEL